MRRTDGICPRCGLRPRRARSSGRLRSWCGPCESAQKAEYMRTEAGRATMRRYYRSNPWPTRERVSQYYFERTRGYRQ